MAISLMLAALIGTAIAGIASAGVAAYNNERNIDAQEEANEQNVKMQQETNEQAQYNAEHAHQIEMADLEAAGLNPVLTATGGNGAPLANISAPSQKPVVSDMSGVSSSISSMMNSMAMVMMASSMAKTNEALLDKKEAGKNARLNQVLAARSMRSQAAYSAKHPETVKKAVKKVLDDDGPLNWDFLDDPPGDWWK